MKTLYLIRGLPGAGKTSLAEQLGGAMHSCYSVSADEFMRDRDGHYNFNPSLLPHAHRACLEGASLAMERDANNVMVHNTFTTEQEMQPYIKAAEEYGYRVVRLIVENTHGNKSVHNVPAHTMERMKSRFSVSLGE